MIPALGFDAVIFDMDGVVTRTMRLHAAAWKELFDELLQQRAAQRGEAFRPFDAQTDYLAYVDGLPRYEGVRRFLAARGIELPEGDPADGPQALTVQGLGARKDALFKQRIREGGVEVFAPDWDALAKPQTHLAAVGQVFFSIGLGMGVMVTYGAYVPAHEKLPRAALLLVAGDTIIALLAGLMIFPAVFTYGVDPAHGPTLAFAVLPEVFGMMPGGRWFAIAFFLLLGIAALTSSVALLEVPVAWAIARWRWRRYRAAAAIGAFALALGIPVAPGYGVLAPAQPGAPVLLDRIDHASSSILLPLSGIAVALLVGWAWHSSAARSAADLAVARAGALWQWSLRVALPLAIGLVMTRGLGWI